jgi:kumamolisin
MKTPLTGSQPQLSPETLDLGAVDPATEAEVTLILQSRMTDRDMEKELSTISSLPISQRQYLTRGELAKLRGARQEDIQRVEAFAREHHLTVSEVDPASRTVKLRGTLADLQNAFGVHLRLYEKDGAKFRSHSTPILLPDSIAGAVQAVLGLDDRPVARK